jgi:hypothetical protein
MASQTYRYYCLDGKGHLHLPEWFEAESDEKAIALVAEMYPNGRCEVWQGSRLVREALAHAPSDPMIHHISTDNEPVIDAIIFSFVDGTVRASWPGGSSVELGPIDAVTYMMRDFLAQCDLAESLAPRRANG